MRPKAKWFSYLIIFAFIAAMLPTSTVFAMDISPKTDHLLQGSVASATANNVANIRSGPGTGFWIVGVLQAQETVPVSGVSPDGGWWRISTAFVSEGWVAASVVTVTNAASVPVVDPGPIVTVTIGELNVRSGPGELAPKLGTVTLGSQLFLIGRSADGQWLNVRSQFGRNSWVAAEFTTAGPLAGGGADTDTTAVETTNTVPITNEAYVVVNAPFLNVRSGPGVNYTILGIVEGGDQLPIIGTNESRTWFNVTTPFGDGWVSDAFVVARNEFGGAPITTDTVDPSAIITPVAIVNADSLNVRSGPSADFTIVGTVRGGETFDLLARTLDFSWVLVDGATVDGWVNRRYVIIRGDTTNLAVATANNATVTNPATGEAVSVAPEIAGPVAFVATGAINIRSGPNVAFEPIGFVYAATRMPIIGQSADGLWWQVESPFGIGWVTKRLIIVENDATNVPVVQ